MTTATQNWLQGNQAYLQASFAIIKRYLELCVEREDGELHSEDRKLTEMQAQYERARLGLSRLAPLDTLCSVFGLTEAERDIILLCAGAELDTQVIDLCTAIQGAPSPTFGLVLRALPSASWGPLAASAPLRRWQIVDLGPGTTLASRALRLDGFILHFLLGVHSMDERLLGFFEPIESRGLLSPSQRLTAREAADTWQGNLPGPVLYLCTTDRDIARDVAHEIGQRNGLMVYAINAADIPDHPTEQITAARLWERHAALNSGAVLVELLDEGGNDKVASFIERIYSPVVVTAPEPLRSCHRTVLRFDIGNPEASEQRALWSACLGDRANGLSEQVAAVTAHFVMRNADVNAVAARMRASRAQEVSEPGGNEARERRIGGSLWEACRMQSRPRLDGLAARIQARTTWDDLIVSERQAESLKAIVAHVRHRALVHGDWGFAGKSSRGLGISALFTGPSGTGKTTAAEVLANELCLDLYRIDLSTVVSKYIGETEKNLRRIFDAAETGAAILLFDEADALFGKRSEVKDSHDRYANMEVSYLLQKMEEYRGLAILTSNLRDSLDSAFMRRLRFVIEFPFPSIEQRKDIWVRAFPDGAPTVQLDFQKLSRINLSGGNIKNVAMVGAFLAAEEGVAIQMKHLSAAVRTELTKLERTAPERELKDWR